METKNATNAKTGIAMGIIKNAMLYTDGYKLGHNLIGRYPRS